MTTEVSYICSAGTFPAFKIKGSENEPATLVVLGAPDKKGDARAAQIVEGVRFGDRGTPLFPYWK